MYLTQQGSDNMYLYMAVTADKYELPLIVSDKIGDVAKYAGVSKNAVSTVICREYPERQGKIKYVKVIVD